MEVSIFYKSVAFRVALSMFLQKKKIILFLKLYFLVIFDFFFIIAMNISSFSSPAPILHPKMNAKKYY